MDKGILTNTEICKIFDNTNVWDNKVIRLANKLAVCYGLRLGEVLGLHGDCVFEDRIYIIGTYNRFGYSELKTHGKHYIPLMPEIKNELDDLIKANGSGFIFSENGGITPISEFKIKKHFRIALNKIGISCEEMRNRMLSFHSWRRSFILNLLRFDLLKFKFIRSVTGKISLTDYYFNFENNNVEVMNKPISYAESL